MMEELYEQVTLEKCRECMLEYQCTKDAEVFKIILIKLDKYLIYLVNRFKRRFRYIRSVEFNDLYQGSIIALYQAVLAFPERRPSSHILYWVAVYVKNHFRNEYRCNQYEVASLDTLEYSQSRILLPRKVLKEEETLILSWVDFENRFPEYVVRLVCPCCEREWGSKKQLQDHFAFIRNKFRVVPFLVNRKEEIEQIRHQYSEALNIQEKERGKLELKLLLEAPEIVAPLEGQCLKMFYYDGLEKKEIARIIGVDRSWVCKLIDSAIRKLRAYARLDGKVRLGAREKPENKAGYSCLGKGINPQP